jgi:hypothetical protein
MANETKKLGGISAFTRFLTKLREVFFPYTGGTLNGGLTWKGGTAGNKLCGFKFGTSTAAQNYYQANFTSMDFGWNWDERNGAGFALRGIDASDAGYFHIYARNATSANTVELIGTPAGALTWNGYNVLTANAPVLLATPATTDISKKVATTEFVNNFNDNNNLTDAEIIALWKSTPPYVESI